MWRALTEADVLGVLNSPELAAYQSAAIGSGQDPLADSIATVTAQCRGYIADNPQNTLADGASLPERTHLSALHILRVELLTRLDMEVSKDRLAAKQDAIRFFERVSEGKVGIESPVTPDPEETGGQFMTTGNSRERVATRDKLAGL